MKITTEEIKARYAAEVAGSSPAEIRSHVFYRMADRYRVLEGMNKNAKDSPEPQEDRAK